MAWFIIETERKTWTKYLVEAANEREAYYKADAGEYLGYRDGEDEQARTHGPFASRNAALDSDAASVDGR